MKRTLLFASIIAISGLSATATSAFAEAFNETVNVPFAGVVGPSCVVTPVGTPGVLVASGNSLTSTGSVAGSMTVLCNETFTATSELPVETTVAPLTPLGTPDASSSSITSNGETQTNGNALTLSGASLHVIAVDMQVTKDDGISAGAYTYNVPVNVVVK